MKNYFIIKELCHKIYWSGGGNYWFKEGEIGSDTSAVYRVYSILLFATYISMTILEIMAVTMGDFPEDEHRDGVTFSVSHTIVLVKIFSVILKKDKLKKLNKEMINVCEDYEKSEMMLEKYKIMKMNVIAYFLSVYASAVFFVFEGIRKIFAGPHFVTVVTYYPSFEDNSYLATAARVGTTLILCVMMVIMISVDCTTMIYLIMYKYKFVTLRHYFEDLRSEFDNIIARGNAAAATDHLSHGLVTGLKMHQSLLSLSKKIYDCFGTVITLQVCLSIGSTVSLLLQLALSEDLTFMAYMKIIFFAGALYFLLALFLCNAGEITYQASLLSNSIFYCGWHVCIMQSHSKRDVRHLVLISCANAQRAVIMKACNMLELTYATFLQVTRTTYSVFALFYTQVK